MKWGRQRRQQEGQEQSTSSFSLLRLLPLSSWFSKLNKHTRSEPEPPPQPATAPVSGYRRRQTPPPSKPRTHPPEVRRPRTPPPRSSPERPPRRRPSSASDHLSFSPAVLDRLVGRLGHEGITSPRRHSCGGGGDDEAAFFVRSRSRGDRPFESARFFHMASSTEPRFSLPYCRSCRADPERLPGFFRRESDVSSETEREVSSEDDECGENRRRRRPEAAPPRRKTVGGRKEAGEGPPPPKDSARVLTGEVGRRSRLRRPSSPEPTTAHSQRKSGSRRSFSFGGKVRQRSRVKVYSPRAAARERNAYTTSRKKVAAPAPGEGEEAERKRGSGGDRWRSLESYAVVKCSTDPQGDFRESMVEMIRRNGIGRPEEMEGLLACYLALNADEYHDVIVKVFRQVWLDLRIARRLLLRPPEFA